MGTSLPAFRPPSAVESILNRFFGFLVSIGLGPAHCYLLQVRGRKSGKIFSTPVNLFGLNGKKFLVAPRGRTQWVRNAEAAGEIMLKKGSRQSFRLRVIPEAERPEILKTYLDLFRRDVQRFFTVPAGSPVEAFIAVVQDYPAFELLPA